jgi:hypothetical protein
MKKQKLVMIGNGWPEYQTIEELLKLDSELYEITIFGAEPHPEYNRILLSPVLAGEQTLAQIILNDLAWYKATASSYTLARPLPISIVRTGLLQPLMAQQRAMTVCYLQLDLYPLFCLYQEMIYQASLLIGILKIPMK